MILKLPRLPLHVANCAHRNEENVKKNNKTEEKVENQVATLVDNKQTSDTEHVSFLADISRLVASVKFVRLSVDHSQDEIEVFTFLHAMEAYVNCQLFSHNSFAMLRKDLKGNLQKVREAAARDCLKTVKKDTSSEFLTLQFLAGKNETVRESLLWLKRAFEMMLLVVEYLSTDILEKCPEKRKSIGEYISAAYSMSLAKHHGWIVRKTVSALFYSLPSPSLEAVSGDLPPHQLATELRQLLVLLQPILTQLKFMFPE